MARFILYFLLAAFLGLVALSQTPLARNKVRVWIENRSENTLSIGKIDGFLPFWVHLHDVTYEKGGVEGHFDVVKVSISPTSFFLGHLSLLRLKIDTAYIHMEGDGEKTWPAPPFPLYTHSMKVKNLTLNALEGLYISGSAEFATDFSLNLNISYEGYDAHLRLEGDGEKQVVSVLAYGDQMWLTGKYQWEKETFEGNLRGEIFDTKIASDLTYANHTLSFKNPTIDATQLEVTGKLALEDGALLITMEGERVRWEELIFANFQLEGECSEGKLSFALSVDEFAVDAPAYEVFPPAFLELKGVATVDKLLLEGDVGGLGSTPFTLLADIPLQKALQIDPNAPFSLRVHGNGSIDPLLAFLENASIIAHGNLDIDLALTGTWNSPELDGKLIYSDGRVESLTTGAFFRDIEMELEGEDKALVIRSMRARDAARGDLSGEGEIAWNPEEGFPFAFVFNTSHFTLLTLDPLTATVDARLTVSGNIHEMFVGGEAHIVEGHLAIPKKMPTQVPTVEVSYINPLPTPKPESEQKGTPIPIAWDLNVDAARGFTIEGRGLVSEWRGNFRIFGMQEALQYEGKLKLVQGRFTLIGRTLDLTEGQIQIEGIEPKNITVNLKGDLELAAVTVSLTLTGTLDTARPEFSSTPPMSTNEILSWVLFNQDVNELTPFQAYRLANVLVTFSGKYPGPRVFDNIKVGLGIDVFDITNGDIDSADLTFQVGKYISQGTFVGINKSISGDDDSVMIQTRLYRDFYLEGNYGGSLNDITPNSGKLIFKWYKSY